ncbi:caspase family protein [Streptomyces acidicola]|uniref:caspase, EACC1-associated type n=1 Tax=Streptomyces acidicola TaxID=2596892 RepID=UPI0037B37A79
MTQVEKGVLPEAQQSRAVLIGTRSYAVGSDLAELPGVTGNIQSLGHLLTTRTGLRPEYVRPMLDETEDREVCRRVRQAAREAEDLLVVYFAGHGLIDPRNGELYLALSSSDPDDPRYTAVRFSEIREAVEESPARRRLVILDCCYSGRAIKNAMGAPAAFDAALGQAETRGACTLTATSANQPAIAVAGERHTVFTGALVRLLNDGIPGAGEYLTLDSLYAELYRTLDPQPRRQDTDNIGELALGPNPCVPPPPAAPVGEGAQPPGASQRPAEMSFPADRLRLIWQRVLLFLVLAGPAAGVAYLTVTTDWLEWTPGHELLNWLVSALWLVGFFAPLMAFYALPLIPNPYELRVGQDGLTLVAGEQSTVLPWDEVHSATTIRTRPGHRAPHHLAVRTRRGWIPPPRRPFRPRLDHQGGVLVLCDLRRLRARPDQVAVAVADYAGPLWDGDHDLARTRRIRFSSLTSRWGILGLAAPLAPLLIASWAIRDALFIGFAGTVALFGVAFELLPARLEMDEQEVRLAVLHRTVRRRWDEVSEVLLLVDRDRGLSFLVRTDAARGRGGVLPYDTRLGGFRLVLPHLDVDLGLLDAALRRFAGSTWRGWATEPAVVAPVGEEGPEAVFVGRLVGLWASVVAIVPPLAVVVGGTLLTLKEDWPVSAGVLGTLLLPLVVACLALPLRPRLELRIDDQALRLNAGRRDTRIDWRDVSRVAVVPVRREHTVDWTIGVWFKEGASVPEPWRVGRCFRQWSGGVLVTRCGAVLHTGVTAGPAEVEQALRRFAGPAFRDEFPE